MKCLLDILLIGSSASLLSLLFPGFGYHHMAWIALVPLFLQIYRSRSLKASVSVFLAGVLFYLCLMRWSIRLGETNPVNFCIFILYLSVYYGVFGFAAKYFHDRFPGWDAVTFPSIWVGLEFARTHAGFLSFPQGILGYSQYKVLPVAGISEYTGVYGVSFLIVSVNAALASLAWNRFSRESGHAKSYRAGSPGFSWVALGCVMLIIIGFSVRERFFDPPPGDGRILDVALVQGNAQADEKTGYERYVRDLFPNYKKLTTVAAGSRPSLIVWPSTSVPGVLPVDKKMVGMLAEIARQAGVYLLIGSAGFDKFNAEQGKTRRVANSAFLFSPSGAIIGRYDKIRLLPFDEYLPLRGVFRWPSWIVSPGMTDHHPGTKLTIFETGQSRFGVQICWENMFSEHSRTLVSRGADVLVGQTSEFYAKSPDAHYQHLAFNVFRAIENRVPVLRSSTNGVSCIIDASGRIVASVKDGDGKEIDVSGFTSAKVPLRSKRSFYTRFGDLFSILAMTFVVLMGLAGVWKNREAHETDRYKFQRGGR